MWGWIIYFTDQKGRRKALKSTEYFVSPELASGDINDNWATILVKLRDAGMKDLLKRELTLIYVKEAIGG